MDSNATNPPPPPPAADAGGGGEEKKPHPLDFEAAPQPPQPVREDYVQNAVKFLSHPKVRGSAVVYRRSFLQNKGLTNDEIDEAFRRVPDPQPTAASPPAQTPAAAAPPQQYAQQQQQPLQHHPSAGQIVVAQQQHPRFTWYRAFVAAGLLLGFGASAAVFIKKLFLPRLKTWIRRVVAEADETAQLKHRIDEETKEAVRASSEAVSAIAKTNQELLASKDEEKKILVTLTQALDSQAKVLKSLSESLSHSRDSVNVTTREDRFSHYRPLEEHGPSAARNGPVNTPWRPPQQPNMYGMPNSDFGSGRPSFAPAPTEPMSGSFSRSYAETVQRGDRSSGSKQPWEMQQQYAQPKLGYGSSSHLSEDGSYSETQENYAPSYHQNGKAPDFHAEEPRPLAYEERPPPQRRWVPPQPPGVAMPEAAAAIRQPKSLAKQPSSDASEAAAGEVQQVNGAPRSSSSVEPAEVPVNGGAASDAGRGDIEDQVEVEAV